MDDSVVEESAPATAPASSQAGALRDDQVQNAVQFLLHPKVQASTMDERKKFLQKKGLTEEEIEEAVRIAQPKLDQVSRSQAAAKSTSNTQQANIKTSQSQPNMLSSASPSRGSQGNELQSSSSTQSSWGKILLASMAVVGLGSGLGVLAKKYTKEHLADLWGTTDNGRSVRERKNVEHDERLREISSSIHKLHEAVDRNIKEVSDMNRRLIALESAPSLDHVKTEILNTTQNMITSNSLSELQQEVKSLRTLMLNIATQNGGNGPEDKKSEAAAPPMAKVIDQVEVKPSSSAGGASVPQGLPNARIFRNLANAGKVGQAASGAGSASGSSKGKDDEQISCADSQTKQDDTSAVETNFKEVLDLVQKGGVPSDVRKVDDSPVDNSFTATPAMKNPRRKPWEENRSSNVSQRAVEASNEPASSAMTSSSDGVPTESSGLEAGAAEDPSISPLAPRDFLQETAALESFGRGPAALKAGLMQSGQAQEKDQSFSYLPTVEQAEGTSNIYHSADNVISQIRSEITRDGDQ